MNKTDLNDITNFANANNLNNESFEKVLNLYEEEKKKQHLKKDVIGTIKSFFDDYNNFCTEKYEEYQEIKHLLKDDIKKQKEKEFETSFVVINFILENIDVLK